MAESGGVGIEKEKEEVVRTGAAAKGIHRESVRSERRQLLRLEKCLGGIWVVAAHSDTGDFFARGHSVRADSASLVVDAFRNQAPGEFFDLGIGINSRRRQEFLELAETLRQKLLLQLRKPLLRPCLFEVGVGEFAHILRE